MDSLCAWLCENALVESLLCEAIVRGVVMNSRLVFEAASFESCVSVGQLIMRKWLINNLLHV